MNRVSLVHACCLIALISFAACRSAENPGSKTLHLPVIFSDKMVLQRGQDVPVWGKATPGQTVTVHINEMDLAATAEEDSTWNVLIPAQGEGGPFDLTVIGQDTITIRNILFGEVWFCSGQSNMNMPLGGWGRVFDYEEEIHNANYPAIRLFQVKPTYSVKPEWDVPSQGWKECTPENVEDFSAAAYFFACEIYKETGIPVGLIHSSSGGTPVEAWMSKEALTKFPEFESRLKALSGAMPESDKEIELAYRTEMKSWRAWLDQNDAGLIDDYADSPVSASMNWPEMILPSRWEKKGLKDLDGVVWFRKVVQLPEGSEQAAWTIDLGPTDDYDVVCMNGKKIGESNKKNVPTVYQVEAGILKPGQNRIDVRVIDIGQNGGIWGQAWELSLKSSDGQTIPLSGSWKYKIGLDLNGKKAAPADPRLKRRETVLFNSMIRPLIPYGIRGFLWYQGESNAPRAEQYGSLFPEMIKDWRRYWNLGDIPFCFVQIPNYMETSAHPEESNLAELREAQSTALNEPGTFMAVTIDIGHSIDIHPKNKQEVGRRLALLALDHVYNQDVMSSGPVFNSMKIEQNSIRLSFHNVNKALATADGTSLKGFAISGKDRQFHWADAEIAGNTIIVHSDHVPDPVAVRYAWGANPECNLTDGSGLPAAPFRTDTWPGVTTGKR